MQGSCSFAHALPRAFHSLVNEMNNRVPLGTRNIDFEAERRTDIGLCDLKWNSQANALSLHRSGHIVRVCYDKDEQKARHEESNKKRSSVVHCVYV